MPIFPLPQQTRQLFFELGTLAANNFKGDLGFKLFIHLEDAEPDAAYAKLGLANLAILIKEFDTARGYLTSETVQSSPLAKEASLLTALTHKLEGNTSAFDSCVSELKATHPEFNDTLDELVSAPIPA